MLRRVYGSRRTVSASSISPSPLSDPASVLYVSVLLLLLLRLIKLSSGDVYTNRRTNAGRMVGQRSGAYALICGLLSATDRAGCGRAAAAAMGELRRLMAGSDRPSDGPYNTSEQTRPIHATPGCPLPSTRATGSRCRRTSSWPASVARLARRRLIFGRSDGRTVGSCVRARYCCLPGQTDARTPGAHGRCRCGRRGDRPTRRTGYCYCCCCCCWRRAAEPR